MESNVDQPRPSARLSIALRSWRIRGDARNLELAQQTIGAAVEPAVVSRLERDTAIVSPTQGIDENTRATRVEREARRQLHEQTTQTRSQWRDFRQECFEKRAASRKTLIMRDCAWNLDRKAERAWDARGPSLERRGAMRTIESGVDLHGR